MVIVHIVGVLIAVVSFCLMWVLLLVLLLLFLSLVVIVRLLFVVLVVLPVGFALLVRLSLFLLFSFLWSSSLLVLLCSSLPSRFCCLFC